MTDLSKSHNVWFTISLLLVSGLVLTSAVATYYYIRLTAAEKLYADTLSSLNDVSYRVNLLIEYGNGTKTWRNQTIIPVGWSLYNTTSKVTGGRIEGTWFSFGFFITSINGVQGTGPSYWSWYTWEREQSKWVPGASGAGSYIMKQGDVVAWLLTSDFSATP
jgi:hypothetical protein